MRRISWLALVALLALAPGLAKAQFLGPGWWKTASSASYVGPGDVVAMSFWFGMRAYSAATEGTKAVNICSESGGVDVTCEDELTSTTTGKLVLGTVGATCGGITCTVKTWYDQTGANYCSGAPCDLTQTVVANRATFNISCPTTSYPCAVFSNSAQDLYENAYSGFSAFNTHSLTAVAQNTFTGAQDNLFAAHNEQLGFTNSSANQCFLFYNNVIAATANDNAWHAIQGVVDDSVTNGSELYIDGTATPGSSSGGSLQGPLLLGGLSSSQFFGGYFEEIGFSDVTLFSGTQASNLNSNQHAFYGF